MELKNMIREKLGVEGRMISGSKSFYRKLHPDNLVCFNANICIDNKKVWWGDVDLTLDKNILLEIAVLCNEDIYVLQEMDARFENEDDIKLERYIAKFGANGKVQLNDMLKDRYEL